MLHTFVFETSAGCLCLNRIWLWSLEWEILSRLLITGSLYTWKHTENTQLLIELVVIKILWHDAFWGDGSVFGKPTRKWGSWVVKILGFVCINSVNLQHLTLASHICTDFWGKNPQRPCKNVGIFGKFKGGSGLSSHLSTDCQWD